MLDPGWKQRAVSAADAVKKIKSGDRVFIHGASATPTPLIEAHTGDPVRIHVIGASNEQNGMFSVEKHEWPIEPFMRGADLISVVEFADRNKLRKIGGSLFENTDAANLKPIPDSTAIRQGVLETSNVNPVEEMTKLIQAHRLFEQDLKAVKTYGELLGREANDVGKL